MHQYRLTLIVLTFLIRVRHWERRWDGSFILLFIWWPDEKPFASWSISRVWTYFTRKATVLSFYFNCPGGKESLRYSYACGTSLYHADFPLNLILIFNISACLLPPFLCLNHLCVPMRKFWRQCSVTSSIFSRAILNATCSLLSAVTMKTPNYL